MLGLIGYIVKNIASLTAFWILVYFAIQTVGLLWTEWNNDREENQFYIMPVTGFCYAVVSGWSIWQVISQLYLVVGLGISLLENPENSITKVAPEPYQFFIVNITTLLVFIAFTNNCSKSFYTVNSLEMNKLNKEDFGQHYQNNTKSQKIETILRTILGLFFILLEQKLASLNKLNLTQTLNQVSIIAIGLYITLGFWLYKNSKEGGIKGRTRVFLLIQSICGLILSAYLVWLTMSSGSGFYEQLLSSWLIAIICALGVTGIILFETVIGAIKWFRPSSR